MACCNPTRTLSRECVERILKHHLDIPEERFFKMDLEEFNKRQQDASYTGGVSWDPWTLLLVCKTWRGVGEKLLYHTVVIRSLAQAYTLMDTFRSKQRLASFVKRLRLEGPYGVACSQIIHFASPTVTDVWLNFSDCSEDTVLVQPYRVSIPWLNPLRCAIYYALIPRTTMWDSVRQWQNLRHLSLPCTTQNGGGFDLAAYIPNFRTLETFELADTPIAEPDVKLPLNFIKQITTDNPALRKFISYREIPLCVLQEVSQSGYEVEDRSTSGNLQFPRPFPVEIFDNIIGFALKTPNAVSDLWDGRCQSWYNKSTALNFFVVSVAFKEMTLAYLCRRPYISGSTKLVQFTNLIRVRNDLMQRVVGLDLNLDHAYHSSRNPSSDLASTFALNFFCSFASNLRVINIISFIDGRTFSLPCSLLSVLNTLEHLEEISGASLGRENDDGIVTPAILAKFTSLRRLVKAKLVIPKVPDTALPQWELVFSSLQALEIDYEMKLLWTILHAMELPSLRRFGCTIIKVPDARGFFIKHGHKLEYLSTIFYDNEEEPNTLLSALCPNLTELELRSSPADHIDAISHDNVKTMIVSVAFPNELKRWFTGTDSDGKRFPALQKIHNKSIRSWNVPWQNASAELANENITLVDYSGSAWRRRHSRADVIQPVLAPALAHATALPVSFYDPVHDLDYGYGYNEDELDDEDFDGDLDYDYFF